MINFVKFTAIILVLYGAEVTPWRYEDQYNWHQQFPDCGLNQQSPININTKEVIAGDMPPLTFHNYDSKVEATITNNCQSAEINLLPNSAYKPQISGGPLDSRYELLNVHFHWQCEHTINAQRHDLEMHAVHYNTKYSPAEAANYDDGFAVIATFYRISLLQYFAGLQDVTNALPFIRNCEATSTIRRFDLSALMGGVISKHKETLYTYKGSLTTPPCSQAVTWLIFPETIPVNRLQLSPFKSLSDASGSAIETNFRALQAIGDRTIFSRP